MSLASQRHTASISNLGIVSPTAAAYLAWAKAAAGVLDEIDGVSLLSFISLATDSSWFSTVGSTVRAEWLNGSEYRHRQLRAVPGLSASAPAPILRLL